jgi:hypothetical protein
MNFLKINELGWRKPLLHFPHGHAAEHRRSCRGFALFEAQPSLQSPGSIEEYPMRGINSGHPACGGTSGGVPFLRRFAAGSFLWASKEMNRRTNEAP